ncbi:MAG: SDR family oxidoreductase [Ktedonobacterales bacterium]
MEIRERVVLITGASAGIGLATAKRFAAEGAQIALAARSKAALEQLADALRAQGTPALAIPTDMREPEQVHAAIAAAAKHFGRLDILINNAGQAAAGTVADLSLDDFRQIVDLNVFGPLVAMQAAVPVMRQQGGGLIINVSSMVSRMRIPGLGAYAATKAALNMLSDTARGELANDSIRVITVYPRMTATDFGRNSLGNRTMRSQQRAPSGGDRNIQVDSPELVAERILDAAIQEPDEQFMDA